MQTSKSKRANGSSKKSGRSGNQKRLPGMGYAAVAASRGVRSVGIPRISVSRGFTHIGHREYFATVASASTDFAVNSYSCNPGVAAIFPWLSKVAQRFETYRFRKLEFGYDARCATSQVGTTGLVFDFDAADPPPTSQMNALSYHDKSADVPWKEQCVKLDLAQGDRLPSRYTRVGVPAGQYDIKTYDVGRLHVFTDGVGAVSNLGLLRVDYEVDLYTPQIQDPMGGLVTATAGLSRTNLFGTDSTPDAQANLPGTWNVPNPGDFTFDQTYEGLWTIYVEGTGLGTWQMTDNSVVAGTSRQNVDEIILVADTAAMAQFRIRAVPGSILSPSFGSATTVTLVRHRFAEASYDALN